jgi:hypothetical protein
MVGHSSIGRNTSLRKANVQLARHAPAVRKRNFCHMTSERFGDFATAKGMRLFLASILTRISLPKVSVVGAKSHFHAPLSRFSKSAASYS